MTVATRVGSWLAKPAMLRVLIDQARLALRLMRDPAVPQVLKAIPVVGGIYLIWPLDILPDLIPVLGQLDDIGMVMAALGLFLKLCPPARVAFHREAMATRRKYSAGGPQPGDIDAEFRRG